MKTTMDMAPERIEVMQGRSTVFMECGELRAMAGTRRPLVLDLGTGDGAFAYRMARADPDCFVVGVDPARDRMAVSACRARRKPTRGGAVNLVFVVARAEAPPRCFDGWFDRAFINFPWVSLQEQLIKGCPELLRPLAGMLRPGARLAIVLNRQVFDDPVMREKLSLPVLTDAYLDNELAPRLAAMGLAMVEHGPSDGDEPASSWGGRLVKGSGRASLRISLCRLADRDGGER